MLDPCWKRAYALGKKVILRFATWNISFFNGKDQELMIESEDHNIDIHNIDI